MTKIKDKFYPLKVWLSTILCASIFFTLFDMFGGMYGIGDFVGSATTLILANFFLGLPSLLLFYFGFVWINNSLRSIKSKRLTLILFGFLLFLFSYVSIHALFGRDVYFTTISILTYIDFLICIVLASLYFGRAVVETKH